MHVYDDKGEMSKAFDDTHQGLGWRSFTSVYMNILEKKIA